jgi:hypothetical protein
VQTFTTGFGQSGKAAALIAFSWDITKWPGVNQAFLFSFGLATGLALLAIPYAKRRPQGTPTSWGEAMLASVYAFGVMFIAFGVVPHQWIDHADKELGWSRQKMLNGPFDIVQSKANGGWFPFNITYEAIRDSVVVLIHVWYFGLIIFLWKMWQTRGERAKAAKEITTSTYGRPLVRKT